MAVPQSQFLVTEEEYLAMERDAEERHEYIDGYVFAMAGESPEHGEICANLGWIIGPQLRGAPCRMRTANSKVRSGPKPAFTRGQKGLYSYPDLFVICGELQFHDKHKDVIVNPTVIFEVLSESTASYDRGEKFLRYQNWCPTLRDYVLISQTSPTIEHYSRQPDGSWTYRVYQGLEASFSIKSIKCNLKLSEVYERVKFPPVALEKKPGAKKTTTKKTSTGSKGGSKTRKKR
ncbi:MAG: hypothetical protein JMDDDDMK_02417 [Acidobacteria bacterium]|nr:hypothetical protein [Acidobacteriota bacterium]